MSFDSPSPVIGRLEQIENDLAIRQLALEDAARKWFIAKRDKEEAWANCFVSSAGTVADRKAMSDLAVCLIGKQEEAEFEAVKAVCRVLDTRAAIGMSVLKAQSR